MKGMHSLCHGAAWLAMCGMCLPTSRAVGDDVNATLRPPIHDVALGAGGLLVGQVVDNTMQPKRGTAVAVAVDGQTAAATTTDASGVFAVAGLRGGVHQVVAGDSMAICRLWVPGTAPPGAASHLRFIPGQSTVVRGQWGPPPSYNSMMGWAMNPWVIGGVVATAIAVPIVLHNLDDDDDNGS